MVQVKDLTALTGQTQLNGQVLRRELEPEVKDGVSSGFCMRWPTTNVPNGFSGDLMHGEYWQVFCH